MPEKTTTTTELLPYEYGAMSSRYKLFAENKLTAYATMIYQYQRNNHLIAIYSPESSKEDSWLNVSGRVTERIDEIFGGKDSFDKYFDEHISEITACHKTITQIC